MFFEKKEEDGGTNYLKVKPVFFQYASKSVRKWKAIPVPFQKKNNYASYNNNIC